MSGTYSGFSTKTKLWIIALGAFVAIINLGIAWKVASTALTEIPMSSTDIENILSLSKDIYDPLIHANNIQLRTHVINTQVHLKGVTNKQSIIVVAIGSGFALMAIGFALFLIGADGAFSIQSETSSNKLVFTATAPGLLCFVLAALLIGMGLTRKHEINLGGSQYVSVLPSNVRTTTNQQSVIIDP